jgi:5-methylthioadenosine/S-adenosylhomocysteine deaminase
MKYPAPDADAFEDSIAYAREFIKKWKGHPLIVPAIAPHAPYSTTPEILRTCAEIAKEFDVPLHIHISETAFEVENMRNEQGMPVVPYVKKQGVLEAKVIAAHCVHIDVGEMRKRCNMQRGHFAQPVLQPQTRFGICPRAQNARNGIERRHRHGWSRLEQRPRHVRGSAPRLFRRQSCFNDPTHCPRATALTMATRMGAQALHIGDIDRLTGSWQTRRPDPGGHLPPAQLSALQT